MSAETVTLEIHRDAPPDLNADMVTVVAKRKSLTLCGEYFVRTVVNEWHDFEWWSEMPAPVKPKRFVVIKTGVDVWAVVDDKLKVAVADSIGSKEAAQRIADIYEETTP